MLSSLSGPLDRLADRERVPQTNLASPTVWLPVIVLCAVGLALRLIDFNRGLWEDEMTVAYYTEIGVRNVIQTVALNGSHPPLYFLLVAVDAHLGMGVVAALRAPSVAAGVATIAVVYLLVLRLVGRAGALLAAALVTFSPFLIWYSDEGRMYALVWFFVLVSYLLLVWGHDSRHWRIFAILHGASVGLALWTDYSAALALAPQVLLILLLRHRGWFLGSWVVGWISILPWFFFLREQLGRIEAQRFPGLGQDLQSWVTVLLNLAWVRADYASLGNTLPSVALVVLLILLVVAAAGTVVAGAIGRLRAAVVALCLTGGAFAVALALALQGTQAVILPRVLGVITFGFVLVFATAAALLIARDSRVMRAVAAACAAVLLAVVIGSTADVLQNGTNGVQWDRVAHTIQANAQPGDELIYYPIAAKYAVEPYLPKASPWHTRFDGSWPKDAATADQSFATWTAGKDRVWVVFYALTGVDMPQRDVWFTQHNLCRLSGDPMAGLGLMEYQASPGGCPPT